MISPPDRSTALDLYLRDMMRSLECGAPYSALAMALSIPDICGSIQYPNSNVGERYICWVAEWGQLLTMSAEDCYAIRCAYLHNGSGVFSQSSAKAANFARVEFTVGQTVGGWASKADPISQDVPKGKIRTPIEDFCKAMVNAAMAWRIHSKHDSRILAAVDGLMQIEPAEPPSPDKPLSRPSS
jgi:hypothetical protein